MPTGRVDKVTDYNVTAKPWDHGWELHIDGVGVTQCTTLDQADRQVRDFIRTMLDLDAVDDPVTITPEATVVVGEAHLSLKDYAERRRELLAQIEQAAREVDLSRTEVMRAMKSSGYSYADIAGVVGVSKGRVSQLIGR